MDNVNAMPGLISAAAVVGALSDRKWWGDLPDAAQAPILNALEVGESSADDADNDKHVNRHARRGALAWFRLLPGRLKLEAAEREQKRRAKRPGAFQRRRPTAIKLSVQQPWVGRKTPRGPAIRWIDQFVEQM